MAPTVETPRAAAPTTPSPTAAPTTRGRLRQLVVRFHNVLFFVGGFLFDWFTVGRIDSWIDIGIEIAYIAMITVLLVMQQREQYGDWWPRGPARRLWRYADEALHFLYGGLLSINVVLYVRSSAAAGPAVFLVLLVATMILNELPAARALGFRLRLALYAFCLATVLLYLVPLILGRMGTWVFLLSLVLAGVLVWALATLLSRFTLGPARATWRLALPGTAVLVLILALYLFRLVPPVPLSIQGHGVYHDIERTADGYVLRALPSRFKLVGQADSRPFRAREGDRLVYFVRVFAPRGFAHRVTIRWERWEASAGAWVTTDRIPLEIIGGRDLGFRGYAIKANYDPGEWRVATESEDGRVVGLLGFRIVADASDRPRRWVEYRM